MKLLNFEFKPDTTGAALHATRILISSRRDNLKIAQRFNVGFSTISSTTEVPKGGLNSLPQITLIKLDSVLREKRAELFLKGHVSMMLLLRINILDGGLWSQTRHENTS